MIYFLLMFVFVSSNWIVSSRVSSSAAVLSTQPHSINIHAVHIFKSTERGDDNLLKHR